MYSCVYRWDILIVAVIIQNFRLLWIGKSIINDLEIRKQNLEIGNYLTIDLDIGKYKFRFKNI